MHQRARALIVGDVPVSEDDGTVATVAVGGQEIMHLIARFGTEILAEFEDLAVSQTGQDLVSPVR